MNILITSASRKVGLVRAFQQALAQEGGGMVVTADASPLAPALYFADEHYLVPPSHRPEFLSIMLSLCELHDIKLLVPTRDEELPFFAAYKEKFAEIGTSIMVAALTTVGICQDKRQFIKFCRENGVSIPKSYEVADLPDDIEFPLFVKPRRGKGGKDAMRVNSKEELELIIERVPEAIIQEFVQAQEYTIDLFADFSGKVISVVPRERLYIFGGESFISRTSNNSVLIEGAAQLALKLHLIGHNTIQCFFDEKTVKFIEVNPRFGGAAQLGFAAGALTPLFLVKLLRGEVLEPKIGKFKDNYFMMRYTEDLFLDGSSLSDRMYNEGSVV